MHDNLADHLTDDVIDDLLGDVLDDATRRANEEHVRACSACSARVARAAETELALLTLATEAPPRRRAIVRRSFVGVAFAVAAAAAAIVWALPDRPSAPERRADLSSPPPPSLSSPPSPSEVPEASEIAFVDVEEQLQLPSSAELVEFIPEAAP
jgi:hypothetical protein